MAEPSDPVSAPDPTASAPDQTTSADVVVAIGASAGGLEPLEDLFDVLPDNTGAAFVVIQHLSPDFRSLMDQLLARHTDMAIHRATDGMLVAPNSIYLIPPRFDMRIVDRRLQLTDQPKHRSPPTPIDIFFRSQADDVGPGSIVVILSGTGSDGSRGIVAAKDRGGLVFVQDPVTAGFDGMPRAAIATGAADMIAGPREIGARISELLGRSEELLTLTDEEPTEASTLNGILHAVQKVKRVDFRSYKQKTIYRRLRRRMQALGVDDLSGYRQLIESDANEPARLFSEFLIGVTEFFRDGQAFEGLQAELARLVRRDEQHTLRLWCAGCSTGEEAYSVAILIEELLRTAPTQRPFKVFATDLDERALARAAEGFFPDGIQDSIDIGIRQRYFERVQDGFRVNRGLRDRIVFAQHNVLSDPPFTRMHVVVCRNMLIYLQQEAQRIALNQLDFALIPGGMLFLGPSESLGDIKSHFTVIDQKWKMYRKHKGVRPSLVHSDGPLTPTSLPRATRPIARHRTASIDLRRLTGTLIDQLGDACVVVNEAMELLFSMGNTNRFLSLPSGNTTFDLLQMLPQSTRSIVAAAMRRASQHRDAVCHTGVEFYSTGEHFRSNLRVTYVPPIAQSEEQGTYLLIFGEPQPLLAIGATGPEDGETRSELERELQNTRENLSMTIEELEATNEELQSTNEELLSSNEELLSTNEELHSLNEELFTVNAEHQRKIEELTEMSNDIENLLTATEIGTIFVDPDQQIRRFTPSVTSLISLVQSDVGRPLGAFAHELVNVDLSMLTQHVLDGEASIERRCLSRSGRRHVLRIMPYRAAGKPDGAVLTLTDITRSEAAHQEAADQRARFETLSARLDEPMSVIRLEDLALMHVTPAFAALWGRSNDELLHDGDAWMQALPPIDRERFVDGIAALVTHGKRQLFCCHLPGDPDGDRRLGIRLEPVSGSGDHIDQTLCFVSSLDADAAREFEAESTT